MAKKTHLAKKKVKKSKPAPAAAKKPAPQPKKTESLLVRQVIEASAGILRLAPTWVPRSFLMRGKRIKLAPQDLYALGGHRGGIDERWFGSTTPAANAGAPPDEGLSYVVSKGERVFTLREAISLEGPRLVGPAIWERYQRWPVYSKFFDNFGPIPHHMHQNDAQAKLVGQQGKPESYYFPPQLNAVGNNFPYTFFGLEPGTTNQDIVRCLDRWNEGDNGILNYSKAYRLLPGPGWLVLQGQPLPGAAGRRSGRRLDRQVDRLRHRRRRGTIQCQGVDPQRGGKRHGQGRRGVRPDRGARERHLRRAGPPDAGHDTL